MVIHPPPELRPYAIGMIGFSSLFIGAIAGVLVRLLLLGDHGLGPFGVAALVCGVVVTGGLSLGLMLLTRITYRGPEPEGSPPGPGEDKGWLLAGSLLVTGSAILGMALTMIDRFLAGRAHVPGAVVYSLAAGLGLLGLALLAGSCLTAFNRIFRGPARLELDRTPVRPGETLRGRVEVPFAAARALTLRVDLELIHTQPGPSPDDPPQQDVLFRATVMTVASELLAPRRSAAVLEIPLDLEPDALCAFDAHCFWHMTVTPESEKLWWNAVFEPAIDLKPAAG